MLLYLKACDLLAEFVFVDFFLSLELLVYVWHKCIVTYGTFLPAYKLNYHLRYVSIESTVEWLKNDLDALAVFKLYLLYVPFNKKIGIIHNFFLCPISNELYWLFIIVRCPNLQLSIMTNSPF